MPEILPHRRRPWVRNEPIGTGRPAGPGTPQYGGLMISQPPPRRPLHLRAEDEEAPTAPQTSRRALPVETTIQAGTTLPPTPAAPTPGGRRALADPSQRPPAAASPADAERACGRGEALPRANFPT